MDRLILLKNGTSAETISNCPSPKSKFCLIENTNTCSFPIPRYESQSIDFGHRRSPQRSASFDHFDRFIPKRSRDFDKEMAHFKISAKTDQSAEQLTFPRNLYQEENDRVRYSEKMHLLCGKPMEGKLYEFNASNSKQRPSIGDNDIGNIVPSKNRFLYRKLPEKPEKIFDISTHVHLDDPINTNSLSCGVEESFVLNMRSVVFILQLKKKHDYQCIFKYNNAKDAGQICCSVLWCDKGDMIALGSNKGLIKIYDTQTMLLTNELSCKARVNCLTWNQQRKFLCSGDSLGDVNYYDLRAPMPKIASFNAFGDKTGLSEVHFSPDGKYLALGGTRTGFGIWEGTSWNPYFKHTTAANRKFSISWCPWKSSSVAVGGSGKHGTGLVSIWNIHSGSELNHVITDSKINKVIWNGSSRELVTGHNHHSKSLAIWKYNGTDLLSMGDLRSFQTGVINIVFNADETVLAEISVNEKLHLWQYFQKKRQRSSSWNCSSAALNQVIR